MRKGIEKLLEPPFKGGWLKKGEKILVSSGFSFTMGHDAPSARTKKEAIKEEVRKYLLSGNTCFNYSTRIWFVKEPCDIQVIIYKKRGIQVKYGVDFE